MAMHEYNHELCFGFRQGFRLRIGTEERCNGIVEGKTELKTFLTTDSPDAGWSPWLHLNLWERRGQNWSMRLDLAFEISEAVPIGWLIQIHFGDRHCSKRVCGNDSGSIMTVDCRSNPITAGFCIGTTHEIDVIFSSSG